MGMTFNHGHKRHKKHDSSGGQPREIPYHDKFVPFRKQIISFQDIRIHPIAEGPAVTVFGSARNHIRQPVLDLTRKISYACSMNGILTITGGGPGIMNAAHEGVEKALLDNKDAKHAVGVPLTTIKEPATNHGKILPVETFDVRKPLMINSSVAYIYLPGGLGTLDEFFDVIARMEKGAIASSPILLVDSEQGSRHFYKGFYDWVKMMADDGHISHGTFSKICLCTNADEVISEVKSSMAGKVEIVPAKLAKLYERDMLSIYHTTKKINSPWVVMVGSASLKPDDYYYLFARELASMVASQGIPIFTTRSDEQNSNGISSAVVMAACKAGAPVYEFTMVSDGKQRKHINENHHIVPLKLFESIKYAFAQAEAFQDFSNPKVFFPGYDFTNALRLEIGVKTQMGQMKPATEILVSSEFYGPFVGWAKQKVLVENRLINPEDYSRMKMVNTVSEAFALIKKGIAKP